ncbi:hypothetical protein AURANDRAFT_14925, partial [Aureococcus anophagefferens]
GLDTLVRVTIDRDSVRIENRANGMTLLYHAASRGWCEAITWLLEQGADVNVGLPSLGWTPLHDAALQGHLDAAVLLLDADARVDVRNNYGNTALHNAAFDEHTNMLKLLLSRGASIDVRN